MNKLVILGGPTAIGKTKIATNLALKFNSSIISADSRQIYKELNIGVACPSKEELKKVPHYFIKNISIHDEYTIGNYEKDGLNVLSKLFKKNKILFLCGGSGMYIDALCEGMHRFPIIPKKIKEDIQDDLKNKGLDFLVNELKMNDFNTYNSIDIKNSRRVTRALEVFKTSSIPYSKYIDKKKNKRNFETLYIALIQPREILYETINKRVDTMIRKGLLDEAKTLHKFKNLKSLQTIGYQELFHYIDGSITLEEAIEEIKKNTRRYAKRQATWFNNKKYNHLNPNDYNTIYTLIKKFYK